MLVFGLEEVDLAAEAAEEHSATIRVRAYI